MEITISKYQKFRLIELIDLYAKQYSDSIIVGDCIKYSSRFKNKFLVSLFGAKMPIFKLGLHILKNMASKEGKMVNPILKQEAINNFIETDDIGEFIDVVYDFHWTKGEIITLEEKGKSNRPVMVGIKKLKITEDTLADGTKIIGISDPKDSTDSTADILRSITNKTQGRFIVR